jgi:hypothetical protein
MHCRQRRLQPASKEKQEKRLERNQSSTAAGCLHPFSSTKIISENKLHIIKLKHLIIRYILDIVIFLKAPPTNTRLLVHLIHTNDLINKSAREIANDDLHLKRRSLICI